MSLLVCALLVWRVPPAIGQDDSKFYVEFGRPTIEHGLDDLSRRAGLQPETPRFWAGNTFKIETGVYFFNNNFEKTGRSSIHFLRWSQPLINLPGGHAAYNDFGFGLDMFVLKRLQPARLAPFVGGAASVSSSSFTASASATKYEGVGIHLRPRVGLELDILRNRFVLRGEIGRVFSVTGDHEFSQTGRCVGYLIPAGGCFARVGGSVAGFVGDFTDIYQGWSVSYLF